MSIKKYNTYMERFSGVISQTFRKVRVGKRYWGAINRISCP